MSALPDHMKPLC